MSHLTKSRDQALDELTTEFSGIPVRIVIAIFAGYLERDRSVLVAKNATRLRLIDACVAA